MRGFPVLLLATALLVTPSDAPAQGCPGCPMKGGARQEAGPPPQAGMGRDDDHMADMQVFHYLLEHRTEIRRTVTILPDGIETLTESDTPEVAAKIKGHVTSMYKRVDEKRPIHQRDPLFREIFANAGKIDMKVEPTEKGVKVVERSADPYVAALVQEHAKVLDLFIANGMSEMHKDHPVPPRK